MTAGIFMPGFVMRKIESGGGGGISDAWGTYADIPDAAYFLSAVAVGDYVYAIGGGSDIYGSSATRQYNPATDSWSSKTAVPASIGYVVAALVSGSKILVTSGVNMSIGFLPKTTYIYDPSADSWSTKADMPAGRRGHAAAPLSDGRVLVCGGSPDVSTAVKTTYIYDPTADSWSTKADMPAGRVWHAAAPLSDGRVLVCGGSPDGSTAVKTTYIYG